MEEDWKEKFKITLKEEIAVLSANDPENEVIATIYSSYYPKLKNINVNDFFSAYKPDNKHSSAIITMALYLWEYEARFGFCLNVLCYILVSNGHDLYDRNFADSFEEIESIGVQRKCEFLSHHGFEVFDERKNSRIKKFRDMRNNVAHYKLKFNDEGVVLMYSKEASNWQEVPLINVQGELMDFSSHILEILWSCILVTK